MTPCAWQLLVLILNVHGMEVLSKVGQTSNKSFAINIKQTLMLSRSVGDLRRVRPRQAAVVSVTAFAGLLMVTSCSLTSPPTSPPAASAPSPPSGPVTPKSARFSYGFDFAQQGPYLTPQSSPGAVASARRVLSSVPGMLEDTSIMDWGLPDPEPSPGRFSLSALASRISLITSTGGTPVVTLAAAPDWMKNATGPDVPPSPTHYKDFARLAAKIAQSFPDVKYFVVWNEFKGFWSKAANTWNIQQYTAMYNDVYRAIKRVRPLALVGGPYAPTPPYATPQPGSLPSTPHGAWGYLDQRTLNAIRYWLAKKAGADFIAVDGRDFPKSGPVTDPLTATEKYAAVDLWLRQQTSLPIWWMESAIQPADTGWSESRAATVRVATLVQLASSGARVGMQWQPQQGGGIPDEGLWTTTKFSSGGQPTALARILPRVLAVLRDPVTVVPGQWSPGVLVTSGSAGTIAINTTTTSATALVNGTFVWLRPGDVRITSPGDSPPIDSWSKSSGLEAGWRH